MLHHLGWPTPSEEILRQTSCHMASECSEGGVVACRSHPQQCQEGLVTWRQRAQHLCKYSASHDKRHLYYATGGRQVLNRMYTRCRALHLPPGHGSRLGGTLRDCRCLRRSLRSLHAFANRPFHPALLTSCGWTCALANSRLKSFSQSSSEEARRLKSLHVHAKRASSFACRKEQYQNRATLAGITST